MAAPSPSAGARRRQAREELQVVALIVVNDRDQAVRAAGFLAQHYPMLFSDGGQLLVGLGAIDRDMAKGQRPGHLNGLDLPVIPVQVLGPQLDRVSQGM